MLKFGGTWRYENPGQVENSVVWGFRELINRICAQGDSWETLEHFKCYFATAAGLFPSHRSSDEVWASTDLDRLMRRAADNAPLFIEAFHDACEALGRRYPDMEMPGIERINGILNGAGAGFQINPPRLVATRDFVPIAVPDETPALDVQAKEMIEKAWQASARALDENDGRQAVQELLWLLETISAAFRGLEFPEGSIQGRYFNEIVGELRKHGHGHQKQIIQWMMSLYGYLSSPTRGGVRHGLVVNEGVALGINEARLYCNLVRSYLTFLISEHERLSQGAS